MKILLAGINGQLGQELHPMLVKLGDVTWVDRETLDLSQPDMIRQVIAEVKPDLIVNACAYTAVDKAESEPDLAMAVNGSGVGILAAEALKLGARLIHVSTDYVFDGSQSHPYQETDPTNPIGVYGRSKLAGEEAIQQVGGDYIIVRTAWVYGVGGVGNFVKTMLRLGSSRDELRVVTDQVGSPTWAKDLAEVIVCMIQNSPESGIYHYTNSGVCSWYDFAIAIFEEAKALGFPLQVQRVVPITTAEYPTPAKRPAYSVLSHRKISAVIGTHPPHWRQSLRLMLKDYQDN
ncbi:dTDP-4-dehydrorhamnose reductase [Planktothricoides raciborskii]|uniref:dTDP-4-dehydrorhamnose reductase n=1 Tax=Planktothricoides raciborskii GIHE-MW2 TaxID=2792601 RepID=A0AAU8JMP8_9CYAN